MPGAVIPAGPAPAPERGTREARCHGWQTDKATGIGSAAETLNRHSGLDPESRVFKYGTGAKRPANLIRNS